MKMRAGIFMFGAIGMGKALPPPRCSGFERRQKRTGRPSVHARERSGTLGHGCRAPSVLRQGMESLSGGHGRAFFAAVRSWYARTAGFRPVSALGQAEGGTGAETPFPASIARAANLRFGYFEERGKTPSRRRIRTKASFIYCGMDSCYKTNYLRRKRKTAVLPVIAVFSLCLCLFLGIFAWNGRNSKTVSLSQEYFLVVRECVSATAAAVAGEVYLSGGAGYLYETGGKSLVVLACYFSETAAESVCRTLSEKGTEASVLCVSPQEIVVRGSDAENAPLVEANALTADSCIRLLYRTANGLERTECSQEEARAALRGVAAALSGLCDSNGEGMFREWNAALRSAERKAKEIAEGLIFAKDVRYLQVQLCLAVVSASDYF